MKEKKYRACLLGVTFETGNMGVNALLASLVRLIADVRPEAQISLLYGHEHGGRRTLEVGGSPVRLRIVNYRLSPKSRPREHLLWIFVLALIARCLPRVSWRNWFRRQNPLLRALAQADFIGDIHGGDSFSDIYGLKRFLIEILPDLIVLLTEKPLVLLPQTYGPYRSAVAGLLARFIMCRSSRMYARDRESIKTVKQMLGRRIGHKTIEYCPDVAFALEPEAGNEAIVIYPPLAPRADGPLIGLNVSGLLYMGGYNRNNMFCLNINYKEFIDWLITRLMTQADARLLLIPHVMDGSEENDLQACHEVWGKVARQYPGRVHLLESAGNAAQIKRVIGQCDFFFGSRMHACIGALSQGIPSVGLAYSPKFEGVFEGAGVKDLAIDVRRVSAGELLNRCVEHLQREDSIRRQLTATIPIVKAQLALCFEYEVLGHEFSASDGHENDDAAAAATF